MDLFPEPVSMHPPAWSCANFPPPDDHPWARQQCRPTASAACISPPSMTSPSMTSPFVTSPFVTSPPHTMSWQMTALRRGGQAYARSREGVGGAGPRGLLRCFESGHWRSDNRSEIAIRATDEERKRIADIEATAERLRSQLRSTPSGGLRLAHVTDPLSSPPIKCPGFTVNGEECSAWPTEAQVRAEPGLAPVHLLLDTKEGHLRPLLASLRLPFVHEADLKQGDGAIVAAGRLVLAFERKREDDLLGNLERYKFQREALLASGAGVARLAYVLEGIPRWESGGARLKARQGQSTLRSARLSSEVRDGLRWVLTQDILATLAWMLEYVETFVAKSSRAWVEERDHLLGRSEEDRGGHLQAPTLNTKTARRFFGPKASTEKDHYVAVAMQVVPGCSFWQGLGVEEQFGSMKKLIQALETAQAEGMDPVSVLSKIQYHSESSRRKGTADTQRATYITKRTARNIVECLLGTGSSHSQ